MELIELSFANCLDVPPSKRSRVLLRELPLRPERLAAEDLRLSCLFALETLRRINSFNLSNGDASLVVERARRVLRQADTGFNKKFEPQVSQALAGYYIEQPTRALWHQVLSAGEFEFPRPVSALCLPEAPARLQDAVKLLFTGEPYLAWQQLSALGFDSLTVGEREELAHWRFFSSTLIGSTQETKAALRAGGSTRFPLSLRSRLSGFAVLLARGDEEWLKDRALNSLFHRCTGSFAGLLQELMTSDRRLEDFENFFVASEALVKVEERILALYILRRQLRKPALQQMCEHLLREISLQVSDGETALLWDLVRVAEGRPFLRKSTFKGGPRLMASVSLSVALTRRLGPRRTSQLLSGKLQLTDREVEDLLDLVASYMSRLKGPMMKLGQTLSYTQVGLPSIFSDRLASLQSQSQAMSVDLLLEETPGWKTWLKEIDPTPLGVGSIGQVHRGRLLSGEDVAIKFRFPEVESAVRSDFRILRALLRIFSLKTPNLPLASYLNELERQIRMECDFIQEGRALVRFRERFAENAHIIIPKIHLGCSTANTLVTELMQGKTLQEAGQASQAERDHWGKTLVHFVVSSCRDGDFNTDPHPGNFMFRDDELICLDFGSTYQMGVQYTRAWGDMILACVHNDLDFYKNALALCGLEANDPEKGFRDLVYRVPGSWTYPVKQPLDAKVIGAQVRALSGDGSSTPVPPEFIFGLRVYFGHLSVVSALAAENDWNVQVRDIMRKSDCSGVN